MDYSSKRCRHTVAGMAFALCCWAAGATDLATELAAAEKGDCVAMHNTGALYASRRAGQPDYASAMTWFRRAARLGNHDSMYSLGIMYRFGQGVDIDMVQASAWYALAAKRIPKNGDEWLTPRAKVAMYLRTADEVRQSLTVAQVAEAESREQSLEQEIPAGAQSCR